MKTQRRKTKGFSLVELMVSVGITAIMMVGISTFFSGTFQSIFIAQQEATVKQGQFVVNQILTDKFANLAGVLKIIDSSSVIIRSEITKSQLPFSYIGKSDDRVVFKDFLIFNDVESYTLQGGKKFAYANSGSGTIEDNGIITRVTENFGGFVIKNASTYYVALPHENEIRECAKNGQCNPVTISGLQLSSPMDVEFDSANNLYISDSGNDRIIKYDGTDFEIIVEDLNFPTSLAYYDDGEDGILFVSNTLDNEVIGIDLTDNLSSVVAGGGDDESCDNTARYCKLNMPTDLVVDADTLSLFIADTGNNRILKVTDPRGDISEYELEFTLDTEADTQISRIDIAFPFTVSNVNVNPETSNKLHLGKSNLLGNTLQYSFNARVLDGEPTLECGEDLCFERFTVPASANVFEIGDDIELNGQTFTVDGAPGTSGGFTTVYVTPKNTKSSYSGFTATVTKEFTNGIYSFSLNLSDSASNITDAFNPITISIYDENGDQIGSTDYSILRWGNRVLGTSEDIVSVVLDSLNHPTGVGYLGVNSAEEDIIAYANSLGGQILLTTAAPPSPITPYSTNFSAFDYTSDFTIESLLFTELNDGAILELAIDTGDEIYEIDAKIP